jgi:hypothetical protein
MRLVGMFAIVACAYCSTFALAQVEERVATAALDLKEPVPKSAFMQQLSMHILDKECWSATNEVVVEFEGGAIMLQHIDRFFGEMNVVFGADHRTIRPESLPADARWYFCFEVLAQPNDFGIYEPVVKTHLLIPPDMSS